MKIIIVGVGKVGLAIAREMEGEQHDLTLVDVSDEVLERANSLLDGFCISGNGACASVLLRAGVPERYVGRCENQVVGYISKVRTLIAGIDRNTVDIEN